jgi:hypothetical protein
VTVREGGSYDLKTRKVIRESAVSTPQEK